MVTRNWKIIAPHHEMTLHSLVLPCLKQTCVLTFHTFSHGRTLMIEENWSVRGNGFSLQRLKLTVSIILEEKLIWSGLTKNPTLIDILFSYCKYLSWFLIGCLNWFILWNIPQNTVCYFHLHSLVRNVIKTI